MYSFVDTIEGNGVSALLPAEALGVNGRYIENEIDGYRTLHVSGRELLESEINDIQIGYANGAMFQNKRNPVREITVTYRLMSKSAESFRQKFNVLSGILEQEEARLVFADEPDKYFIGTKSSIGEVQGGQLNVIGDFTFYCCDPYKHSTVEKTFPASLNSDGIMEATVVNNGTTDVPISYEITHNHENGYIGIVSEHGAMQYGYVDELDGEVQQKSQVLVNYQKTSDYDAMTNGEGILTDNFPRNGTFKPVSLAGKQWLALDNVGSGPSWHGASKIVTLPADAGGSVGAVNFLAQTKVYYATGKVDQTGLLQFAVGDENGQLLASIHIFKATYANNTATAVLRVGTNEFKRINYMPTDQNITSRDKGQIYIKKTGAQFEFYFGGVKYPIRVPEFTNKKGTTLTIFLGQIGTYTNLLTRMYFDYLIFQKNNVNYWYDIPNRYRNGSVLYIDGDTTKAYVDGVKSEEITGSDYFLAPPGETKVQFYYSNFSVPPPTIKAKIREAYL